MSVPVGITTFPDGFVKATSLWSKSEVSKWLKALLIVLRKLLCTMTLWHRCWDVKVLVVWPVPPFCDDSTIDDWRGTLSLLFVTIQRLAIEGERIFSLCQHNWQHVKVLVVWPVPPFCDDSTIEDWRGTNFLNLPTQFISRERVGTLTCPSFLWRFKDWRLQVWLHTSELKFWRVGLFQSRQFCTSL